MKATVRLNDIVDALESTSDEIQFYLNLNTGEVLLKSEAEQLFSEPENTEEEYPDWDDDMQQSAEALMDSEDFIPLPDQYEIHEYTIMEDFCRTVEDKETRDILFSAIRGSGAFRVFKESIRRYDLEERWYQFRAEAFRGIAIEWCEMNDIPYSED